MINDINVSIVVVGAKGFLLIKRAKDEDVFPGYWGIPGGALEIKDVSLETAINRECVEEVGVTVKITGFVSSNIVRKYNGAVLYIVYQGEILSGSPKPLENTDKVAWKSLNEASKLQLTPKTLEMLKIVANGVNE